MDYKEKIVFVIICPRDPPAGLAGSYAKYIDARSSVSGQGASRVRVVVACDNINVVLEEDCMRSV